MYDFSNFGTRLNKLRKDKRITQEELALRVGVTGQAVSKWENDQSYPDITLIPSLAQILGTNIEYLFGVQKAAIIPDAAEFPAMFQGLPLVHHTEFVACYSAKDVASTDATGVKFADGSTAELTTRIVTNVGRGEIELLPAEDVYRMRQKLEAGVSTKDWEFDYVPENLSITIMACECRLERSASDKLRVRAACYLPNALACIRNLLL